MSGPMQSRLIYDTLAGVPSCHASTLAELPNGDLVAAWFGGAQEGSPDSSHYWSRLRHGQTAWDEPAVLWDVPGHAAGNPRLFTVPNGDLWAILPVNYGKWCNGGTRFYHRVSPDLGATWSDPIHTPELDMLLGKNKPVVFPDGRFVLPVTMELTKASAAIVHLPESQKWVVSAPISLPENGRCIQPSFVTLRDGRILAFFRTGCGRIWKAYSRDRGLTWSQPVQTALRNNDSGLDLARLANGHLLLAFNDTEKGRTPLNLAVSTDGGETWPHRLTIAQGRGEFSYPTVIQSRDGLIHLTYTDLPGERKGPGRYGSKVRHVVLQERHILDA